MAILTEETTKKLLKIFSSDITENSNDKLRIALGTYYKLITDEENNQELVFPQTFTPSDGAHSNMPLRPIDVDDEFTDLRGVEIARAMISSNHNKVIEKIEVNPSLMTEINSDSYIPNFKIPVRIYSNRDSAIGDQFWKTYFMGGKYADKLYPKIIDDKTVFYDIELILQHPYSYKEAKEMGDPAAASGIWKIQSNYNDYDQYVQQYQDWSATKNELLLPNFIFSISAFIETVDPEASPAGKQRQAMMDYYYPYGSVATLYEKNRWCGDSWIKINQSSELQEMVVNAQRNIIMDQHFFDYFSSFSSGPVYDLQDTYTAALASKGQKIDFSANMFNIEIKFARNTSAYADDTTATYEFSKPVTKDVDFTEPTSVSSTGVQPYKIRTIIENNNFSSKFLETLKDLDEGTISAVSYNKTRYHTNSEYLTELDKSTTEINNLDLKTFDWMQFLLYTYNEYDGGLNDNYCFMGPLSGYHDTTYADSTLYRFSDNQNVLKVINSTIELKQEYFHDLIRLDSGRITESDSAYTSEKILNTIISPVERFSEVLAYKIEKFGGAPTGDSATQNLIQKFWVFNDSDAPEEIKITDTQVKYGQEYTYKGYAYVAVMSHKYKYSDFRLTKQIGTYDVDSDGSVDRYCVQFYDPLTDDLAEQIFLRAEGGYDLQTSVLASAEEPGPNTFATNGQEFSEHPQLADFNLNVEPCMKIIQVPIFEKTLAVHDNPPNMISVVPFHFIDDSKKIGFNLFPDNFKQPIGDSSGTIYPLPITDSDQAKKISYLNDKDLLETGYLPKFSESPARYIEIFRSTKKPTSFKDFDGKLVSIIDLRIPNEEFNRKDFIAADEISTNVKYYYIFRFVNENNCPGPLSTVIEAELVDDGGYTYSLFDIIDSSEFKIDPYVVNANQFKKIIQLEPNIQQLVLDTENVNFSNYAKTEIDKVGVGAPGIDKVWDKKFKIRLTSKKTGKKLDINVTYNLREKDLSPPLSYGDIILGAGGAPGDPDSPSGGGGGGPPGLPDGDGDPDSPSGGGSGGPPGGDPDGPSGGGGGGPPGAGYGS